jgi:ABC-type protease/lipase transport system fused ATPase/permease subunit
MGQGLRPIESSIGTWRMTVSARAAFQRIKSVLEGGAKAPRTIALPTPEGFLAVERVVVSYPGTGKAILKGVSFKLQAGQFLGIVGPSGAGKSTLARVMIGALVPTSGTVRLDGAELKMWNARDLGHHIGYMPQDVQLFAGTVADNIARMAEGASADAIVAAAKRAGVHDAILRLPQGYATKIGDAGSLLSGGEKQRLALARALYGDPRVLLFDEPNANLDTEGEQALLRALAAAKEAGRTLVVVTHRPSLLKVADLVLVLREGLVTNFGPRRDVLAKIAPAGQGAAASVHYLANAAPGVSAGTQG